MYADQCFLSIHSELLTGRGGQRVSGGVSTAGVAAGAAGGIIFIITIIFVLIFIFHRRKKRYNSMDVQ